MRSLVGPIFLDPQQLANSNMKLLFMSVIFATLATSWSFCQHATQVRAQLDASKLLQDSILSFLTKTDVFLEELETVKVDLDVIHQEWRDVAKGTR